jgi:arylsulfatase
LYNRPHSITANVELTEEGAEGVLLAHGNRHGGYSFYIKDGYLHHVHNYLGLERFTVRSPDPVPTGEVELRYEFEPTGEPDFPNGKGTPGRSQLYVNRELVASIDLPYTVPNTFGIIGLTCGRDGIDAVDPGAYGAPYTFTGEINEVILDLSGDLVFDEEAAITQLVARQ